MKSKHPPISTSYDFRTLNSKKVPNLGIYKTQFLKLSKVYKYSGKD